MRSAIIVTVLNEARHIRELLTSLESQTRIPEVIVITDGGSTDGTQEMLQDFASTTQLPFHWEVVPGNRSRGRNAAIRLAHADAIAVTDVNVLESHWFERIVEPLERGDADVVAGWYAPIGDTPRERAMGCMTLYSIEQIEPGSFVPASRSIAFTRAAWERVGGYEEQLDAAEDTYLVLAMLRGGRRPTDPRNLVAHLLGRALRRRLGVRGVPGPQGPRSPPSGSSAVLGRRRARGGPGPDPRLRRGSCSSDRGGFRSRGCRRPEQRSVGAEQAGLHRLPSVPGLERGAAPGAHPLAVVRREHEPFERPLQRPPVAVRHDDPATEGPHQVRDRRAVGREDRLRAHHRLEHLVRRRVAVVRHLQIVEGGDGVGGCRLTQDFLVRDCAEEHASGRRLKVGEQRVLVRAVAGDDEFGPGRLAGRQEVQESAVLRDHAAVEDGEIRRGADPGRPVLGDVHDLDDPPGTGAAELRLPAEVRHDDEVGPLDHPPLRTREPLA